MSELPLELRFGGRRFPGFDVIAHSDEWDRATQAVVGSRLGMLADIRFFTQREEAVATALFDQLLYQREEPRVPVVQLVDSRLAEKQTDGWHYDTMPTDDESWRRSLAALDDDATAQHGCGFPECDWDDQTAILQAIHDLSSQEWHGLAANQVWGLWTRYACTAFYAHPWAWNEIGFDGPRYPRGYKNLGLDRLEGFEVPDARPHDDPAASDPQARKAAEGSEAGSGRHGAAGNAEPGGDERTSDESGRDAAADHPTRNGGTS